MNNITIELCAEDRARIDNLIEELAGIRQHLGRTVRLECSEAVAPTPQEAETPEQPLPPVEAPKAEAPKPAAKPEKKAAPEPAPAAQEVTVAELQAKVVELVNAGKKTEAREIISKYSPNVSGIPEDKRAEVLELLNGLEG